MRTDHLPDDVWTVSDFLTTDDCNAWIARAESLGFDDAPVTTSRGPVMMSEVRNNTRVMIDDLAAAQALWTLAAPWVPTERAGFRAIGLNERFRLYRYAPGQYFAPHLDGAFRRSADEVSLLTMMVYLNADCVGGATRFHPRRRDTFDITPTTGTALFFEHRILHEGAPLLRGWKYVLRTDVMFRRIETP